MPSTTTFECCVCCAEVDETYTNEVVCWCETCYGRTFNLEQNEEPPTWDEIVLSDDEEDDEE